MVQGWRQPITLHAAIGSWSKIGRHVKIKPEKVARDIRDYGQVTLADLVCTWVCMSNM